VIIGALTVCALQVGGFDSEVALLSWPTKLQRGGVAAEQRAAGRVGPAA
jgi:hypothetical protein